MNSEFPSYSFKLEFFDERAELVRPYVLIFHTQNNSIELYDVRQRKMFLRKTTNHNLELSELYIGNKILLNGRQYDIMDYGDVSTQRTFNSATQHTFALLLPNTAHLIGDALDCIYQSNLIVAKLQYGFLDGDAARRIFNSPEEAQQATSGPVVAMELVGGDAIAKWNRIQTSNNFGYGSLDAAGSSKELDIVFNGRAITLASEGANSTLCVIKPHAVKEGLSGQIIKHIVSAGFRIGGAMMTTLEISTSQEFFEVYKGVVAEFSDMAQELSEGPCIALELVKDNAVKDFRELCGPRDVYVAKQIRPKSLRAVFGTDIIHNAVHCTDLEEDAALEVEYFFVLLDQ